MGDPLGPTWRELDDGATGTGLEKTKSPRPRLLNPIFTRPQKRTGKTLIRCEDLARQPETTLARVCDTIGEAHAPDMLQHGGDWIEWNGMKRLDDVGALEGYLAHHRLRTWQVNQPLFDGSGRWRTELTADEQQRFKELGQRQLESFGYVDSDTW